jgi:hypothetical protein
MRNTINGSIVEFPVYDDFTTDSNGYVNVPIKQDAFSGATNFWNCEGLVTKTLYFKATTNNLYVKILGSLDRGLTFPITAVAEFTVAVGYPVRKDISADYHALKIQVTPASDNLHGTLSVTGGGSSFTPASNVTIGDINIETDQIEDNQVLGNASLSSIDTKVATSAKQILTYKGQDRTTTTGAAEELTIPANSQRAVISCGPSAQVYININADASTLSPLYFEDPFGPITLDLLGVTKLSAWCVAGNVGAVFFG